MFKTPTVGDREMITKKIHFPKRMPLSASAPPPLIQFTNKPHCMCLNLRSDPQPQY